MSDDSNVVHLHVPHRTDRKLSGRADAASDLRRRFRDGGRAQQATFVHLARQTFVLVQEIKATFGERAGKMQLIFGELLKQKKRFILAEDAEPGSLCLNPGNWIEILRGLAIALGRDPDRLFLDVMRGSPLMPAQHAAGYRREQWQAIFQDLMIQMVERLTASVDYGSIATYLADAGLIIDDGQLLWCETQDGSVGIDVDGLYSPAILSGMPHVLGLNFRTRVEQSYGCIEVDLQTVLMKAELDASIAKGEREASIRAGTRTGLAIALNDKGTATIALFEWEVLELVFKEGDANEWVEPIYLSYADLDIQGDYSMVPVPNSMRFHFLGSTGFDAVAATHIVYPEVWADSRHQVWDPGHYDAVEGYPTDAPDRTVGAVIERNLLYASPEHASERIDTLLLQQLQSLQSLVDIRREGAAASVKSARLALLGEWDAAKSLQPTANRKEAK